MSSSTQLSVVVVGGGIVGLSIAYELAKRGLTVTVLEKEQFGKQASWAGAGIITPANAKTAIHPLEQLEALSHSLHEVWSAELKSQTEIDNGFRKCGGLYVARTGGEVAAITGLMGEWAEREIEFSELSLDQRTNDVRFSILGDVPVMKAIWVPGESVFDNRLHLQSLVSACQRLGVQMRDELGEVNLKLKGDLVVSASSDSETFEADSFVVAAGPWSQQIVDPDLGQLPMQPVRGQIALYKCGNATNSVGTTPREWPILNEGSRYLVPRSDGRVIAGATIEEVGFDCQTTANEIADLRNWAEEISTHLTESTFVESWAGIRPGTYDGFPYIGPMAAFANVFIAAGHFKSGLHLSTGTAVAIADLVENKPPEIDLIPFAPARASTLQQRD
jgi:glycine oxidase